jgi:putative ABC transport system permease protein
MRFALRELRSGLRGFRLFLACIALGVAAIAAAGSTAEAFREGLAAQAREILGGDLAVSLEQRAFTRAEQSALERLGRVSYAAGSRAMAEASSGARRLVELRGVSAAYPLAGRVDLAGGGSLAQVFRRDGPNWGVVVERPLLDQLGLKLGDHLLVGNVPVVVRAILLGEPDRLSLGFSLGPRVLAPMAMVEAGGFLSPGLPYAETARIALRPGVSLNAAKAAVAKAMPAGVYRVRDRTNATPGLARLIDQLEYFLGFIGLSSLIAGGIGVSAAVNAHLAARKPSIATLKALGATGALARNVYLAQIALMAALGVSLGLVVGALAPLGLGALVSKTLPVPALFAVYPAPLARAALFGVLAAGAFSLAPLARARRTPPSALFRQELLRGPALGLESVAALACAGGLVALTLATAPSRLTAEVMVGGVAAAFAVLFVLGLAAAKTAGQTRGVARGWLKIGLVNLAGPKSAARIAAPAIGLGVALLAAVVLIQSSLVAEVGVVAPRAAPALVFTEIPPGQGPAFDAAVASAAGRSFTSADYVRFPFASGRIVAIDGRAVDKAKIAPEGRWAYDADLSVSAIGAEPANAGTVAGRWWPPTYAGAPLVALDSTVAQAAGLRVGDRITVELLGRQIEARIAALRKVDVAGFGPDFTLVIDPDALGGAALRQVAIAKASRTEEDRITRALGRSFPTVEVISVREQLEAAAGLFDRLKLAVRGAAAVAALAGLLALASAIAAGARSRAREAAMLKALGAARWQVLAAYLVEYGAVGAVAGLAGVALGFAAAWPIVTRVFEASWSVDWAGVAGLVLGVAALTGAGGLLAALHALSHRTAPVLSAG